MGEQDWNDREWIADDFDMVSLCIVDMYICMMTVHVCYNYYDYMYMLFDLACFFLSSFSSLI